MTEESKNTPRNAKELIKHTYNIDVSDIDLTAIDSYTSLRQAVQKVYDRFREAKKDDAVTGSAIEMLFLTIADTLGIDLEYILAAVYGLLNKGVQSMFESFKLSVDPTLKEPEIPDKLRNYYKNFVWLPTKGIFPLYAEFVDCRFNDKNLDGHWVVRMTSDDDKWQLFVKP